MAHGLHQTVSGAHQLVALAGSGHDNGRADIRHMGNEPIGGTHGNGTTHRWEHC